VCSDFLFTELIVTDIMQQRMLTYEEFVKEVRSSQDPFAVLTQGDPAVYVYALTRDCCAGCETQAPLFDELTVKMKEKYGHKVKFAKIHVSEDTTFQLKLQDLRRVLKFPAYPTYIIFIKTDVDPSRRIEG